jgi:hypothetical protein
VPRRYAPIEFLCAGCGLKFVSDHAVLRRFVRPCPECGKAARYRRPVDQERWLEALKKVRRWHVINKVARRINAESYLEIGLGPASTRRSFFKIRLEDKVTVDPNEEDATFMLDSDTFFKVNDRTFDLIFVDGLHHCEQALKDIRNGLQCLNYGGAIIVHDCDPATEARQTVPRPEGESPWNGDVWKAWAELRRDSSLSMKVIEVDHGCGIITRGRQVPYQGPADTWQDFVDNRQDLLNAMEWGVWNKGASAV